MQIVCILWNNCWEGKIPVPHVSSLECFTPQDSSCMNLNIFYSKISILLMYFKYSAFMITLCYCVVVVTVLCNCVLMYYMWRTTGRIASRNVKLIVDPNKVKVKVKPIPDFSGKFIFFFYKSCPGVRWWLTLCQMAVS